MGDPVTGNYEIESPSLFSSRASPPSIAGWQGVEATKRWLAAPSILEKELWTTQAILYTDISGDSDTSYVAFGVWASSACAPAEDCDNDMLPDPSEKFGTFFHGPPGSVQASATGSATYTGAATGLYVFDGAPGSHRGLFTANATLNVDFGDAAALGTIGGTIGDFKDPHGNTLHSDLTLTLDPTEIISLGSGRTGVSSGAIALDDRGEWDAEFFGNSAGHIGGSFSGTKIGGGDLATFVGAFGAKR